EERTTTRGHRLVAGGDRSLKEFLGNRHLVLAILLLARTAHVADGLAETVALAPHRVDAHAGQEAAAVAEARHRLGARLAAGQGGLERLLDGGILLLDRLEFFEHRGSAGHD